MVFDKIKDIFSRNKDEELSEANPLPPPPQQFPEPYPQPSPNMQFPQQFPQFQTIDPSILNQIQLLNSKIDAISAKIDSILSRLTALEQVIYYYLQYRR